MNQDQANSCGEIVNHLNFKEILMIYHLSTCPLPSFQPSENGAALSAVSEKQINFLLPPSNLWSIRSDPLTTKIGSLTQGKQKGNRQWLCSLNYFKKNVCSFSLIFASIINVYNSNEIIIKTRKKTANYLNEVT